jgi:hypothetical protein
MVEDCFGKKRLAMTHFLSLRGGTPYFADPTKQSSPNRQYLIRAMLGCAEAVAVDFM